MEYFNSLKINNIFNLKFVSRKCILIFIVFLVMTNISYFHLFPVVGQNQQLESNLVKMARNSGNAFLSWVKSDFLMSNSFISIQDCERFIADLDYLLEGDSLTGGLQLIQYFLWTNRSSCQLIHDFGGIMMENPSGLDGQKAVCIEPNVAPEPDKCLVYSFGIHNEWSFDEQMELYGCEVFAFDPSMGMDHHDHSPRIHFFNWGLGDVERYKNKLNFTLRSLSSIYETLSAWHGLKVIDYLKIDIEYSEWTVLPQIIESGMLANVRQLGVEIHLKNKKGIKQLRKCAKILRRIEKMGMIRFDSKRNPWFIGNIKNVALDVSLGYEIAWYNNKFIKNSSKFV